MKRYYDMTLAQYQHELNKYPVMENLYAFNPQLHALTFMPKDSTPSLDFHPSNDMKKPTKPITQTLKRTFEKKEEKQLSPVTKKARKE